MRIIEFSKNEEIIVKGPCNIKVIEGNVFIQGIEVRDIHLPNDNSFTIYTIDNFSKISLDCNILSKTRDITNWHEIGETITKTEGTVVILGSVDSGKTYFSNLLANLHKGWATIIDGDVGQSSLFIPTFISSAKSNLKTLNISNRGFSDIEFLGDITPSTNPRLHISMLRYLYERNKSNLNIIDTDGWVKGYKAYSHKLLLLDYINPDYIIILNNELKDCVAKYNKRLIIAKKPSVIESKSKERRRIRRKLLYSKYFESAKEIIVPTSWIFGTGITDNLFTACGEILQLSLEEPCSGVEMEKSELIGLLVGLIDNGRVVGAGLIKEVSKDSLKIFTPVEEFEGLMMGKIALNDKFEERRVKLWKCRNL